MKRKVAQTIKKIATKVSMLIIISFLFTTNNTDAQCNVSSPSWCTLGNSGTTAGTNFVGTLDLQPLVFKANDSEWMRITTTGNVGIGTTLPSTQLHTTGGVRFQTLTGTGNRIVVTDLNGNLSAGSATTSGVVTGSGTLNYLPKWTPDGATLGNSSIFDNGNVGIGTTSPQAKLEVKNGSVLFNGTSGSTPVNGPGTRMMWIPYKAAFRAGNAGGLNAWNDANIGYYSAAFGINTKASGWFSTAFGGGTIASGTGSTAFGYNNTASGHYSSTFGFGSTANAYGSFVIGQYNAISGNPGTWFPADPLFIIGNGISSSARSNAMTVLKNGKVGIGTSTPTEKLDVAGNIRINGNQIYLAWDNFHGLGYFNTYAGKTIDGPVLYGYSGGALGTKQGGTQNIA
ncbi:MAG: hypothetical protein K8R85_02055 [Bacteroidetes bacterium]|nr:hypothetical protein [Bacteroidota bacterium]